MFNLLNQIILKAYLWVLKHPKSTIAVAFFGFILAANQIKYLQVNVTTKSLIEKATPTHTKLVKLEEEFQYRQGLITLFAGNLALPASLCRINTFIEQESQTNLEITTINSAFRLRHILDTEKKLLFPLLLDRPCEKSFQPSELSKLNSTPWKGIFTSPFMPIDNLLYEIKFEPNNDQKTDYDPLPARQFIEKAQTLFNQGSDDLRVYFVGIGGMLHYAMEGIQANNILNFGFLVFVLVAGRLFWGTFLSGFLFIITLVLMGGFLYATLALFEIPVNMLNSGLFLLVSVSAIEDFAFLVAEKMKSQAKMIEVFQKLILPSFYTSLTTVIGFGSLYFSEIKIVRDFGVMAAWGATLEWAITFLFLPALFVLVPKLESWTRPNFFFNLFHRSIRFNLPTKLVHPLLLLFGTGTWALFHPQVGENPFEVYPDAHPFRQGMSLISETRNWETDMALVFTQREAETKNQKILALIGTHPLVAQIQDPYAILAHYTKDVSAPLTQELIHREYRQSEEYQTFFSDRGETRAMIYLKKSQTNELAPFIAWVSDLCGKGQDCYPTGNSVAYTEFAQLVPQTLVDSFGISLILVSVILFLIARGLKIDHAYAIIVSALWGPFAVLSLIGLLNIPINFLTCMFASVIVGLTGDNAIQYLFAAKERQLMEGVVDRADGSLHIFVLIALGSLLFQLSYFKFSRDFGLILIAGMFLSLMGDLWLLKALLTQPRHHTP